MDLSDALSCAWSLWPVCIQAQRSHRLWTLISIASKMQNFGFYSWRSSWSSSRASWLAPKKLHACWRACWQIRLKLTVCYLCSTLLQLSESFSRSQSIWYLICTSDLVQNIPCCQHENQEKAERLQAELPRPRIYSFFTFSQLYTVSCIRRYKKGKKRKNLLVGNVLCRWTLFDNEAWYIYFH